MKTVEITRKLLGEDVTAFVLFLDGGVHASIYGGSRPHIGAVSVVDLAGKCHTTQFPGHKDGVVSERWAKALAEAGYRPVVVEAGIHYDNLSREGIMAVIRLTDKILLEFDNAL